MSEGLRSYGIDLLRSSRNQLVVAGQVRERASASEIGDRFPVKSVVFERISGGWNRCGCRSVDLSWNTEQVSRVPEQVPLSGGMRSVDPRSTPHEKDPH